MTSDELRRGPINRWDPKQVDEFLRAAAATLYAAADAWEAERAMSLDALRSYQRMVESLHKRLEEAEKAWRDGNFDRLAAALDAPKEA